MAFITKRHLPRRTFLRGVGVTLALPFLESMLPAATALGQSARATGTRLGCIYFPHGAIMNKWTPATEGSGFELTEILQPLTPFRDRITVVSDLELAPAYGSGATANHNRSAAAFLSGAHAEVGAQPRLGVTIDQLAARKMGQGTPLPSLELMIEESSVNCGDGLNCAYRDTLSWQGASSPLPMENNPQVVFERLFGDGNTAAQRKLRRQQSLSLLDSVMSEATALQRTLPTADRARLDQFLTDTREIERRIQKAGQQLSDDLAVPAAPTGVPTDVEEHIKLMFDLQVLAWQADITRVSTLLIAKELSNAVYPKSGVRDAFHILSHHSNVQENKDRFAVLNRYHVNLFTYFLGKLKATPDGDGTLLDHSLVLYGSGMSDGNQHNHTDLPIIVAGGASGRLTGGRHLRHPKNTPMANLLLALLEKLEVPIEKLGDSSGTLTI
jgi:uncharacterized protein DUF1552